jgi:hypothetical protein
MSILPQAPEAAGVVSATEALPVSVATRVPPTATAVSATSSGSTRPPIQWGVEIPVHSSTSSSSSNNTYVTAVKRLFRFLQEQKLKALSFDAVTVRSH